MTPLSDEEYLDISSSLENYHTVFYKFLEMSSVFFCDDKSFCKTAAVFFPKHKDKKPTLYLNQNFWNGLNSIERLFIICHECLHVILDHGVRNGLLVFGSTPTLVNIAQDICINEMIVDLFGFDRNEISDWKRYCWIDTCFKDPTTVKRNETFTYYLELLIKNGGPPHPKDGGPDLVDAHGNINQESDGGPCDQQKQNQENAAGKLAEELYAGELEEMIKAMPQGEQQGLMSAQIELIIAQKLKRVKFKFTNIIKKLKRTSIKKVPSDQESFVRDDRRFENLIKESNAALPGKIEQEKVKKGRLLTLVFMDVSGSCIDYFRIFEKALAAFSLEKNTFDLRAFTFDTVTEEIVSGKNARGGGGTKFDIIEKRCLEMETEYKRYPDCVIIITDGEGTEVNPKVPKNWVWLLTPINSKQYISPMSRHFLISNVLF